MSKKMGGNKGPTFNEQLRQLSSTIPRPDEPKDRPVIFSFKHLVLNSDKFSINHVGANYLGQLLERLKAVCGLPLKEFTIAGKALRSHGIKWEDTSEPDGFPIIDDVWKDRPWQFSVSVNEHGRVEGFLVGHVFYVVWLDPDRSLYKRR